MRADLAKVITTADGSKSLVHQAHGECYHSTAGARLEAESLYIQSSQIEATLESSKALSVLDVGLGLGYNAMTTIDAWFRASEPGPLELLSLEIDPDLVYALGSGTASWQEGWPAEWIHRVQSLKGGLAVYRHPQFGHPLTWRIFTADALAQPLPVPPDSLHFIWQDPFSPELNPGMWNADWFAKLARAAAPGAVLMSYSVARTVKDALTSAGWEWQRIPATGVKRHWLKAHRMPSGDTTRELR